MAVRLLFLVFFFFAYEAIGQETADAIRERFLNPSSGIVMVAAHRAPHSNHPENSLKAIEEGIELGIDIVEIDVKVSKDGVPFLMHDHTLDRTTTGKGEAEALTWDELQELRIVDKGEITAFRIPSLEEALLIAKDRIMVDLDLKTSHVDEVIKVVNKTNTASIVIFFDSDHTVLSRVREQNPDLYIMPRARSAAEADSLLSVFNPFVVHIDFSFYTKETTRLIAAKPARIWINALGHPDQRIRKGKVKRALKILTRRGANIIQTDEPAMLLAALRKKGLHP